MLYCDKMSKNIALLPAHKLKSYHIKIQLPMDDTNEQSMEPFQEVKDCYKTGREGKMGHVPGTC